MKIKLVIYLAVLAGLFLCPDAQAFYKPSTGTWLSRDPIGEDGGENIYAFVDGNPIGDIDYLGEDFIAVGSHYIGGFGFPFEHMSIEYYREKCPHVTEGTRFRSPSEVGVSGWAHAYELEPRDWIFGHWATIHQRGTTERHFVSDTISFIEPRSPATHRIVIYSDATSGSAAAEWVIISIAAKFYAYAEQSDVEKSGPLHHWPNSKYQLPPGNNSNTFIRVLSRSIGRDADIIGGFHPGNEYPQPVPYPGYTPIRVRRSL